jgi:hypothetical protein
MKKIIKNVLKEFVSSKEITIEVIGNLSDTNLKLIYENSHKSRINLPPEIRLLADLEYEKLKNTLKTINPFTGSFIDKYTKVEKSVDFIIIPTYHYVERLFRKEDPEYANDERVVDPTPFEGVDLIIFNKDRLAQEILTKRIQHNNVVNITTKNGIKYQILVNFFDKLEQKSKKTYVLTLITQLKGDKFNELTKGVDKQIKLYRPK